MVHAFKSFRKIKEDKQRNLFSVQGFEEGVGNDMVDSFCGVKFMISALVAG